MDKVTSLKFIAKGDQIHGVSTIPVKPSLQNFGKGVVKKFRLSRVADRFVKQLWDLYNMVDKAVARNLGRSH